VFVYDLNDDVWFVARSGLTILVGILMTKGIVAELSVIATIVHALYSHVRLRVADLIITKTGRTCEMKLK